MFRKFSFWIWGAIILQWLTAVIHTIGQVLEGSAEIVDEKEKILLDLMSNFKKDYGAGFVRSTDDFFFALGICFTLFCVFGGLIDWWLNRKRVSGEVWKGILLIQIVIYAGAFLSLLFYTFLPPIVCSGLILFFSIGAYLSLPKKA
jgi:hypothetical protein